MKRKKPTLFSPIIFLSIFFIILISFTRRSFSEGGLLPLIPKKSSTLLTSSKFSSKFSFRDLLPHPHNPTHNSQPTPTTLAAVGDIMLGRYCNTQMLQKKDWRYPFLKTADFTKNADITFGNLESPIMENCPTTETGMIFCARPEAIEGLKFAGFDVLSLANNHILNFGQKGLDYTQKFLEKNNILYSPLSSSNLSSNLFSNNVVFGFLSFNLLDQKLTFTHDREEMSLAKLIKDEVEKVDILIVSLHWGVEYSKTPSLQQKELAHQIIDAGAKIIIGHHPHVTQPTESYHNGLIFYSLGNFVFDQTWSEETKKGAVAKIIFEGKEIKSYELIPVYIENFCQPKLLQ